ncbi:hypothetical protein N9K16_01415 [Alphaproteobacteria bacterium]|jgi:hypothetical protein|nr:hypothetical protein [Alphaproteobacteria bacterium]
MRLLLCAAALVAVFFIVGSVSAQTSAYMDFDPEKCPAISPEKDDGLYFCGTRDDFGFGFDYGHVRDGPLITHGDWRKSFYRETVDHARALDGEIIAFPGLRKGKVEWRLDKNRQPFALIVRIYGSGVETYRELSSLIVLSLDADPTKTCFLGFEGTNKGARQLADTALSKEITCDAAIYQPYTGD